MSRHPANARIGKIQSLIQRRGPTAEEFESRYQDKRSYKGLHQLRADANICRIILRLRYCSIIH